MHHIYLALPVNINSSNNNNNILNSLLPTPEAKANSLHLQTTALISAIHCEAAATYLSSSSTTTAAAHLGLPERSSNQRIVRERDLVVAVVVAAVSRARLLLRKRHPRCYCNHC